MSLLRSLVKSALPPPVTIRLRARFKRHELERALLSALCDRDRVGLDIGAALGAYTWPLSRICHSCIAFEPNPDQAHYLRRAFGSAVRVENIALSDCDGEVELVIPLEGGEDQAGLATIAPGGLMKDTEVRRIKVPMRALDKLELPSIGFIKLDVEGHELAVLKGGKSLMVRDRPILLVELEERFGDGNVTRVREFLEPQGYHGLFLDRAVLRPIAAFDPAVHQAMAQWGNPGAYINNFIFIPEDRYSTTRDRLARIGYNTEAQ
jgi:FkbM family methyltransferase